MANAIVDIIRLTGGTDSNPSSATSNSIKNGTLRPSLSDVFNPVLNDPIRIPDAGSVNYSWWANTCIEVTGGDWTEISNIRWYTADSSTPVGWTGVSGVCGYTGYGNYQTPAAASSTSGEELEANYTGISGVTDMFSYDSGGTELGASEDLGTITSGTNTRSNLVVIQLQVTPNASPGTLSASQNVTWQYDEI